MDTTNGRAPEQGAPEQGLSIDELDAEGASPLPDKQAMSVLDITANIDVGLDVAGAVNAAVAANANAAAPVEAAATLNIISPNATSYALSDQTSVIGQNLDADAIATSTQDADIAQ